MKLSAPLLSFVPPRSSQGLPAISALVLALGLALGTPGTASAEAPAKGAPSVDAKEPQAAPTKDQAGAQSFEEVDRMIAAAVDTTGEPQKKALEALGRLGPDAIPALTKKLHELRKERQGGVFAAVKLVKEANSGKLAPEGGDLVDGLLKVGRSDGGGYKATLSIALCLRVLAKIGTTPALKPLVHVAAYHDGALRPEVTRVVKALGEKAVPALIGLRRSDQDLRRWAIVTLEGMGKRVPGDAVQTTNGELLADVLRAYAEVKENDAIGVIISFVNTDRALVRQAARESILVFGQDAVWKLREAYTNLTGKAPGEGWNAEQTAKELFSAYDRARLEEVYVVLDEGLAKQKEGKLDDALAAFDKVLARQPLIDRRVEMVPAYLARAEELVEKNDLPNALAFYRKAARLEGEGARAPKIQADIAFLEGKELQGRGIADTEPFRRALALDPGHPKARAELDRLEAASEASTDHTRRYAAAGAVLAVGVMGIFLFGGKAPRRRRPTAASEG
jgi:tetratricopeptide (TPR) repeat protein